MIVELKKKFENNFSIFFYLEISQIDSSLKLSSKRIIYGA
jgi:hypothetical protein